MCFFFGGNLLIKGLSGALVAAACGLATSAAPLRYLNSLPASVVLLGITGFN